MSEPVRLRKGRIWAAESAPSGKESGQSVLGFMAIQHDDLHAARALYETAGFWLAFQDPRACERAPRGHEQRWELRLDQPPGRPN